MPTDKAKLDKTGHDGINLPKIDLANCEFCEPVSDYVVITNACLQLCITYNKTPFNPGWTIQSDKWHSWRLLSQPWISAELSILPMYFPSPEEKYAPRLYAENVRTLMVRIFFSF